MSWFSVGREAVSLVRLQILLRVIAPLDEMGEGDCAE
jgi:hypothetical protein